MLDQKQKQNKFETKYRKIETEYKCMCKPKTRFFSLKIKWDGKAINDILFFYECPDII